MTNAKKVGIVAHAYGVAFNRPDGTRVFAESEEAVFKLCGVRYRPPNER